MNGDDNMHTYKATLGNETVLITVIGNKTHVTGVTNNLNTWLNNKHVNDFLNKFDKVEKII